MTFHCDKCGLCCRSLAYVPQLAAFDRGDGVCRYLAGNNLCIIYENRPDICNVEKMYSFFASQMSKEDYYSIMEQSCALLKQKILHDKGSE